MREDRWLAYANQFLELLKPISKRMSEETDLRQRLESAEATIHRLEARLNELEGR